MTCWKAILASALFAVMAALAPIPAQAADDAVPSMHDRPVITDTWRSVRQGEAGFITGQPAERGVLVRTENEAWRAFRNGQLAPYSALALAGVAAAIGLFYLVRGKIRMEGGPSGQTILRFKTIERAGHWMTAGSFLVLAFTGLNLLFGRYVLAPVIGKTAFSYLTLLGKWLHNICGFTFMIGLLMILVLWAKDNLWDRYDLNWILKGGGLLFKGEHPPAAKFNFGQKTQYWMVILVGILVSYTGVNLLFPFSFADMAGMQLMQLIHAGAAIVMMLFMLGHIYIGTIGMEGASSAMTTGQVDLEWAREHHSAWVEEVESGRVKN